MMRTMKGKVVVAVVILAMTQGTNCLQRTLDYAFNENCHEECEHNDVRFAHVMATGPNDTIHYLWDFTKNPTMLVAVTSNTAKLQISWKDYLAENPYSLNFTEKPIYSFGIAIERLFEFNDVDDNARIDLIKNESDIYELYLNNFKWHHKDMLKSKDFVEFYAEAGTYNDPDANEKRNGSIKFLMHAFGKTDHSHVMPCMLHSENDTQMDIVIKDLNTKKNFSSSRFALELLFVSENEPNSTLSIDTKRKLDDEFTPGIFEVLELTTPYVKDKSAFLQWRPVSYIASDRDVTNSTGIIFYPVKRATADNYFIKNNLLNIYYGEDLFNVLVQRMNISMGSKGDGFYKDKYYNSWTFIAGYGTPLEEQFSKVVLMIISIGVGIPLLLLTISCIYMCVRRMRRTHSELVER